MTSLNYALKRFSFIIMFGMLVGLSPACKGNEDIENLPDFTITINKPTPTQGVKETVSPVPEVTVTITPTPTQAVVTPEPTQAVEVTVTPEPTVASTSTPKPTVTPIPYTGGQMTVEQLKEEFKPYGSFIGGAGMSYADYQTAMNTPWIEIKEEREYKKRDIDLEVANTYDKGIRAFLVNLSQLDGVQLFDIGHTVQGRPIFMLKIDRTTVENPKTIVLTGSTHARETAGSVFITKQLNDLLNDPNADEYLSKVRIYAVPCVNPDGREGVAFNHRRYTYDDGLLWKANANGVDLNRNFPGLSWGQIKKGNERVSLWSNTHTKMYFPGYTAGSEPETKALMKFLQYTIVDEQADLLIDYHQQGRVLYAGKPWQTDEQEERCVDLAAMLEQFLGGNNTYLYTPETSSYGLRGEGSTLTDYACSLAVGAKFSEKYGFMVYTDGKNEYPLIMGKKIGTEANPNFATATIEIGRGASYLGYSDKARANLKKEYTTYNFDRLLYQLFDYVIENEEEVSIADSFKVLGQEGLPTGCESVSATMLLNWYGYDIKATDFVDKYLDTIPTMEEFYADGANASKNVYDYYFVGDPRSDFGKACNAPVIMKALERYFAEIESKRHVPVNLTGLDLEEVCDYTRHGFPVLLWVSGELTGPTRNYSAGGHTIYTNRHCVVLLSADRDADKVTVADPMIGKVREWSYSKVEEQFSLYGKQAIVLQLGE